jgi:predicted ArsR family transcriptional regulator
MAILFLLKEKSLSYTQIQTKLSTNYDSVKNNCEELETYELVAIKTIDRHPENGKPSYDVQLTERGMKIVQKVADKKKKSQK